MSKLLLTGDGAAAGTEPLSVSRVGQFTDEDIAWAVPQPVRINPYRGATDTDIGRAKHRIQTCCALFLSVAQENLEIVAENLSSPLDTKKLMSQLENALSDPMADIIGALDKAVP